MSQTNRYTINPIAAAVSAALATPAAALAQQEGASESLDEIIVTARKREENIQDIPATIHALPEAMLKEIGALNTEDYVRFMPSVNWVSFNPGGDNFLVFRGINTTSGGFIATSSSSMYLDDIPITATNGSQPEIRMLDVARVEALAGPQGTLFGAAAQAGTLRVITNKPDSSRFEASADVEYRNGSEGDPSYSITGVVNIPLVKDKFAIRIAAQSAVDGGYIDNVLGHTPDTWWGETADMPGAWGGHGQYRLDWGNRRNDDAVEDNWNDVDYTNFRLSARWDVNDDWAVTAAYHYGDTEANGTPSYNPFVGDLQTIAFVKDTSNSEWDLASLTIEADLGFAQLVSATSFYENQRNYRIDNTMYYKYYTTKNYCEDRGVWADLGSPADGYFYYWLWENPATGRAIYAPIYCVQSAANPSGDSSQLPEVIGVGEGPEWQERFTQEIRLSHQGEKFDWLAGLYYEDSNDSWNSVWLAEANTSFRDSMSFTFLESCANSVSGDPLYGSWICSPSNYPNGAASGVNGQAGIAAALEGADTYWASWDDTDWKTKAVFGEVTWHASDKVDVTFGGRWFEITNDKVYTKIIAGVRGGVGDRLSGGYTQPRWEGNDIKQSGKIDEFVPKLSVTYNVNDDQMVYGLYSQGFRTGGVNRANKNADWNRTLWGQVWEPDKLTNYEAGYKSLLQDGRMQLNLTFFYMKWEDFQHETVDPSSGECVDISDPGPCTGTAALPWLSIVGNVGDAHSTGLTAEVDWIPADGWQVGGNLEWLMEAEIDSTSSDPRSNIEKGQELPNFPEFKGALWATKTWPVDVVPGGEMFIRGQMSYKGKTHTALIPRGEDTANPSFDTDAYTLADIRFGLRAGDGEWQVDLFVNNVTDERAQVYRGSDTGAWQWGRSGEYERSNEIWTVRPREFGIRFLTKWGD